MDIQSVSIEKFKRLASIDFDLAPITMVIGGNNSGKSSLLQAIHFAVTTIQSTKMVNASTLASDQLIFKPTNDPIILQNGSPMTQRSGPKFKFTYISEGVTDVNSFEMGIKRGKNANISVDMPWDNPFFTRASDRSRPVSIFVPGLAGVALREELRTEAIINTGIAQGDSNLYLRNVLLRIIRKPEILDRFHSIINQIFPGLTLSTDYDESRHHFIEVKVNIDNRNLPIEMLGTGCLQAIQLVAYTTMYNPALLLLDEPDSHLHPSNQRLLAETLLQISAATLTKIILATHSRHIFDSLSANENCKVLWLKSGENQKIDNVSDLSILLDLGALDSFERLSSPGNKVVVLTEDTKSNKLKFLLEANGFVPNQYFIQPLHGVDNISSAYAVADFFTKLSPNTYVLIHRDGDALLNDEKDWLVKRVAQKLPERTEFFITPLTDIEHQFCQPEHVSAVYQIGIDEAKRIVVASITKLSAKLAAIFSSKRQNAKDRVLRQKEDAPGAQDLLVADLPFEYAKGKTLLGRIIEDLNAASYNGNRLISTKSPALEIFSLTEFAKKAWGSTPTAAAPPTPTHPPLKPPP